MLKQTLLVMISRAVEQSLKNMAKKAKQAAIKDIFSSDRKVILHSRVISIEEEGYYGIQPTPEIKDRALCAQ